MVASRLFQPLFAVDRREPLQVVGAEIDPCKIEATVRRNEADGRLSSWRVALDSAQDPPQHANVLAEAGPEVFAGAGRSEPVHVKNLRGILEALPDVQPVVE